MSFPAPAAESLETWDFIASCWDEGVGKDENKYWKRLQEPSLARLLGAHLEKGNAKALEFAAGNGLCSRWLLSQGAASVLATDGSEKMLEIVRARGEGDGNRGGRLETKRVDVTSKEDLEGLVEGEKGEVSSA